MSRRSRGSGFEQSSPEAIDWAPGTFRLARLPRGDFRDKEDAVAELRRKYPGCTVGKMLQHATLWVYRIREAKP